MDNIRTYADDLLQFFHQRYKLKNKPTIIFAKDQKNSIKPFGKTAHYDPAKQSITVFITGRHIKDCLRSLAHELVHHLQNERGDLMDMGPTVQGYAQKDKRMREMEREAYEKGNMCFRDYEDGLKRRMSTNYLAEGKKGEYKMSYKDWRNTEFNSMLMEKWGYKKPNESSELLKEEVDAKVDFKSNYQTGELHMKSDEEVCPEHDQPRAQCPCPKNEVIYNLGRIEENQLRKVINKLIKRLV